MADFRICPHCRAFVPTSERTCTECQQPMGRPYAGRPAGAAALAGLVPPTHFTTVILLLINSALFAATLILSARSSGDWGGGLLSVDGFVLYSLGAKLTRSIRLRGEWWRLVTAGFLHGGVLHLLMNFWALYDLGAQVEEAFGTARFLVLYLVSSACGFLASCLWTPALSIGASAAIFGLIGAMIAYGYRSRTTLGQYTRAIYTRWAIYGLLFGLMPGLQIDNAAHLGGLAAGLGLGYLAAPSAGALNWLWKAAAAFAVLIAVVSFLFVWIRFPAR